MCGACINSGPELLARINLKFHTSQVISFVSKTGTVMNCRGSSGDAGVFLFCGSPSLSFDLFSAGGMIMFGGGMGWIW
jgi:hypothetical protein